MEKKEIFNKNKDILNIGINKDCQILYDKMNKLKKETKELKNNVFNKQRNDNKFSTAKLSENKKK